MVLLIHRAARKALVCCCSTHSRRLRFRPFGNYAQTLLLGWSASLSSALMRRSRSCGSGRGVGRREGADQPPCRAGHLTSARHPHQTSNGESVGRDRPTKASLTAGGAARACASSRLSQVLGERNEPSAPFNLKPNIDFFQHGSSAGTLQMITIAVPIKRRGGHTRLEPMFRKAAADLDLTAIAAILD